MKTRVCMDGTLNGGPPGCVLWGMAYGIFPRIRAMERRGLSPAPPDFTAGREIQTGRSFLPWQTFVSFHICFHHPSHLLCLHVDALFNRGVKRVDFERES